MKTDHSLPILDLLDLEVLVPLGGDPHSPLWSTQELSLLLLDVVERGEGSGEVAAVAPFVEEAGERGGESGVLRVGPEGPPGLGRGALVGLRRRGGLRGLQVGGSAEDAACGKVDVSSIR